MAATAINIPAETPTHTPGTTPMNTTSSGVGGGSRWGTSSLGSGGNSFWLHNGLLALTILLAWTACIVAYAGELHRIGSTQFHWDKFQDGGNVLHYSNASGWNACSADGGAFIAMISLSFIFLNIALAAMLYRLFGGARTFDALRLEVLCYAVAFFWFFIAVPIWSGCIHNSEVNAGSKASWSGYVYLIIVELLMALAAIPIYNIYRNSELHSLNSGMGVKSTW